MDEITGRPAAAAEDDSAEGAIAERRGRVRAGSALYARLGWALLGLIPAAVIVTAAFLTPDPAGHGTHVQLGLPPCGFLVITGYPCPGCGLTTCFAHMVRLQFTEAAAANVFGVPLFLVSFFTIPVAIVGAARGLPMLATLERLHFEKVAILLSAVSITGWVVRIGTLLALG